MASRLAAAALLLAAALAILAAGVGSVALTDPDESRYAATARNMIERDDFVVPWFNGAMRINKPPLFYWLQAGSFRLFGVSEAAARVPSLAAALVALLAVYFFSRAELGPGAALRAGAILLSTPLFLFLGKAAVIDMTLHALQVSALLLWYRLYLGRGHRRLHWLGVSILLGLAMLAKGPVGFLVPCLVMAVFLALRRDWGALRPKGTLPGALLALAVFLPWGALLVWRLGAAPEGGLAGSMSAGLRRAATLLRRETLERALSGLDHPRPAWYFLVASLLVFFPWFPFLPAALPRAWKRIRRGEPTPLFLLVWIAVVYVFFSLVRGKLITYILPAAPPIAMLLAMEWPALRRGEPGAGTVPAQAPPRSGTVERGPAPERVASPPVSEGPAAADRSRWVGAGAALLAANTAALAVFALLHRGNYEVAGHGRWIVAMTLAAVLAAFAPILLRRPGLACWTLAATAAGAFSLVVVLGAGEASRAFSLRELARDASLAGGRWERVVAYRLNAPSLVFYGRTEVLTARSARELAELVVPGTLVVLEADRRTEVGAQPPGKRRARGIAGPLHRPGHGRAHDRRGPPGPQDPVAAPGPGRRRGRRARARAEAVGRLPRPVHRRPSPAPSRGIFSLQWAIRPNDPRGATRS